ncbi:MAG: alkaline phosphatase family protein [Candidatus Aminicenantes bacterium]|nr:alkaline phosphatase family protein [Candidatus Aminicenantes bacterium]
MKSQLTAIALDAADWGLIQDWAGQGLLPNLKRIIDQGTSFSLANYPLYRNENPWVSLLTGCFPDQTGYWTPLRFQSSGYRALDGGAYSFRPNKPFYAMVPGRRVTVFDIPHCGRLFPEADGVQVLGWGAHSPMGNGRSQPKKLFKQLRRRFGPHPAWRIQDRGTWWDNGRLQRLRSALLEGIGRRNRINLALLAEHPADLTLLAFSEIHIAGHHFWHLDDPGHPAFRRNQPPLADFLLEIYRATDRALGELLERLPADANLLVFSPEGGAANWCDLNSMIFLPELMFRWNFPGQALLAGSVQNDELPSLISQPRFNDWVQAVWHGYFACLPPNWLPRLFQELFRKAAAIPGCNFPFYVLRRLGELQWQPPVWYRPWWPRMKAFALPSYGDGYIRINLRGREPEGIVDPSEYEEVCLGIDAWLQRLRDPRTNRPLVYEVIRTREHLKTTEADRLPDADLVVLWQRQANDMAEEKTLGRLGPVPFWKSGSHQATGFVIGSGPDIPRRTASGQARVIDLAPTILDLLGIAPPGTLAGQPIFQ